jgi:phage anti-repressor protein
VKVVNVRFLREFLGVSANQVYMWHKRRHTTGFPEEVASVVVPQYQGDKRGAPLYDLEEVTDWYLTYDKNKNRGSHWARKREEKKDG